MCWERTSAQVAGTEILSMQAVVFQTDGQFALSTCGGGHTARGIRGMGMGLIQGLGLGGRLSGTSAAQVATVTYRIRRKGALGCGLGPDLRRRCDHGREYLQEGRRVRMSQT